jgi:hypothetical protein
MSDHLAKWVLSQEKLNMYGSGTELNLSNPSAATKSCFARAEISWQNLSRNGTHLKKF